LLQALHMPGSYYSVDLSSSWCLVVLDTTEMSLHSGYPEVSNSSSSSRQHTCMFLTVQQQLYSFTLGSNRAGTLFDAGALLPAPT
jgi:hypothetical protein